jgi:hypothetical protein
MFKLGCVRRHIGTSDALKYLKVGDMFDVQTYKNNCQSFTVLGADIIHKTNPDVSCIDDRPSPFNLIITSNYPFGRRGGDTSLRYVIYAELAP